MRILLTGLGLLALAATAAAEQSVDTGDYVVHYNAIPTELLSPQVARAYGLTRSHNRAMLNVAVLKKEGDQTLPVTAELTTSASNLAGQRRDLEMRLIEEQDARYYIGTVRVSDEEILRFNVRVMPEGRSEPIEIQFDQQFFTED